MTGEAREAISLKRKEILGVLYAKRKETPGAEDYKRTCLPRAITRRPLRTKYAFIVRIGPFPGDTENLWRFIIKLYMSPTRHHTKAPHNYHVPVTRTVTRPLFAGISWKRRVGSISRGC